MNQNQTPASTRFGWWNRRPRWARGGAIFILGLLIGIGVAAPDQAKLDEANAITAKEKAIYAAAAVKRDNANKQYNELTDQLDQVRSRIDDQNAEARANQKIAKRKLDKLRGQIRGTRKTIAKRTFDGEGMYLVGEDVEPGTYKAEASSGCYWARLGSGDTSDIIDNSNSDGPMVLTIVPSDYAVEVARCGTFHRQ